jgi:hypothetical protein
MPDIALDSRNSNIVSDKLGEFFSESEHTHGTAQ